MADTTFRAYSQSIATALSTDLNSLANATLSAASAAIDNSSNLDLFMDLELVLATQGGARSTGAYCAVRMTLALDGTNYADNHATTALWVATFELDAATTARRVNAIQVPLVPLATFKLAVYNGTGQSFAASGNTLKYRTYSLRST